MIELRVDELSRRKSVKVLLIVVAVIQIGFGVLGLIGTYYASVHANEGVQMFDNVIVGMSDLSNKTTSGVGQIIQETVLMLFQLEQKLLGVMPTMFLYLYVLHGMFLLGGVIWLFLLKINEGGS